MGAQTVVVGIDLGGTNLRTGLFTPQGKILETRKAPLYPERGSAAGIQLALDEVTAILEAVPGARLLGIGVGATGPVDPLTGMILNSYTLPTWDRVQFRDPLAAHFGVPAVLENDADVAALGEYWLGAGQGIDRLFAVTVGTGIGTALILDGHIYRGLHGTHMEGGHHVIDPSGPECYCGQRGCWESLASGEALAAYARQVAERHPEWLQRLGCDAEGLTGKVVTHAARQGDPLAVEIIQREAYYLALGLINVITLFIPEVVVLSGGVMENFDLFEDHIRSELERTSLMVPANQVRLTHAALGSHAGMAGAAYALLQTLQDPAGA